MTPSSVESTNSENIMKRIATLLAALSLSVAGAAFAQPGDVLDYTPVECMRGGDSSVFQLNVTQKGELRAYFRHVNSTEWCSVIGNNEGVLSTVVMPKFEVGDEIEYFFVLVQGKRVIAKSPEIYRVKNTGGCEINIARHSTSFTIDCGQSVAGMPASNAAAHALGFNANPQPVSPERP
jgi:hypothetical protein